MVCMPLQDADRAISGMSGQFLGTRSIRVNWATRKPNPPAQHSKPLDSINDYDIYKNILTGDCGQIKFNESR